MRSIGYAIAALTAALLPGCVGGSQAVVPASAPALAVTVSQRVGAQGGTVAVGAGVEVTLPAGWLQQDHILTVTRSRGAIAVHAAGWSTVRGAVRLALDAPAPHGSAASGPSVTLPFLASDATALSASRLAVLQLTGPDGHTASIAAPATIDMQNDVATVAIPRSAFDRAVRIDLGLAVDAPAGPIHASGGRYWNGTTWTGAPYPVDAIKRTVVLVHGIFSSVESAFAAPCPSAIASAGSYQQTYGFDYPWYEPPSVVAPALAAFINSLPNASVDIEAHSYGTVVTLAALPQLQKMIGHVVLLGGPLPLNGSPQAQSGYTFDVLLALAFVGYPSDIYQAETDGMIASLRPNSSTMQSIAAGLSAMAKLPPFVQVAGTVPLPVEQDYLVDDLYAELYGGTVNDGVVEESSALTPQGGTVSTQSFALYHTQLECDPGVVSYVGPLVAH